QNKRAYCSSSSSSSNTTVTTDKTRHSVWMFGACDSSKLGMIGETDRVVPTRITHLPHRLRVIDGGSTWQTSFILTDDNHLFMWGTNSAGQMGLPANQVFRFPTESDMLKMVDIDKVGMGRSFTVILTKQGKMLSLGSNEFGQLGLGAGVRGSHTPRVIETLSQQSIVSIGAGFDHAIAVTKTGHAFGWGYNIEGQIGQKIVEYKRVQTADGESAENLDEMDRTMVADEEFNLPLLVPGLENIKIARVVCGYDCTFFISSRGNVYAVGNNETGTLGIGDDDNAGRVMKPTKVLMPDKERVKSMACGATHALFLSESGRVYSCGWGSEGRLGLGDNTINRYNPTQITFFQENNIKIVQVSAGGAHSLALTDDGKVYSWGCGDNGKLGHGNTAGENIPKLIESISNREVIFVAAGIDTSMLVVKE
ncbi:hypothetical protein SAMD00019534_101640, partial [Acytostelium subglobosum LB1]|uniref:hypothetical protein n=1 Tax=Acytostelium subglobosum LB1 TaxID=1410327 RepID=UPI0006450D22